jgi:hypothetical protein
MVWLGQMDTAMAKGSKDIDISSAASAMIFPVKRSSLRGLDQADFIKALTSRQRWKKPGSRGNEN